MTIPPASALNHSHPRSGSAVLLLNGEPVGTVTAKRWETSWGFGEFRPAEAFSNFAPIFGMWSLLMHANDDEIGKLSRDAKEELGRSEAMLASIKAQLVFTDDEFRVDIAELTIDGDQVEWKEY